MEIKGGKGCVCERKKTRGVVLQSFDKFIVACFLWVDVRRPRIGALKREMAWPAQPSPVHSCILERSAYSFDSCKHTSHILQDKNISTDRRSSSWYLAG